MRNERLVCPDCGSTVPGVPWDVRNCACGSWWPPHYLHPDAPEQVKAEGRAKIRGIALALAGVAR